MREGAESNMRKIAGNFHNWQKKIELQTKEDLQNQEGDIKGPLHQVTLLKPAENQQQTKCLKAEKNKSITLLRRVLTFQLEGQQPKEKRMVFFSKTWKKIPANQILSLENILQNYSYVKMFIDKLKDYFACELKEVSKGIPKTKLKWS